MKRESHSVMSNSLWAHGLYSPWNSSGQNTGVGSLSLFPGIELGSPALQADSLPAEPQGKPKNTGVGSLSLLQRIFLTQELNWGPLHCRQILYQLSYQGSLAVFKWEVKQSISPWNRISVETGERDHHLTLGNHGIFFNHDFEIMDP